jgi:phenylalanyl-tRNA synthetase beta chain
VGLILSGAPSGWDLPGADRDRYLELKGAIESILESLGIDSVETATYHGNSFQRGTGALVSASGVTIGRIGEVAPGWAALLGLERPAWAALLDLQSVARAAPQTRRYRAIPRYPASKRDLAVVVSKETTHAELERAIRETGAPLLDRVRLFDLFEGAALGAGNKSLAYALEFRSPERTLSDKEVDVVIGSIVRVLESKLGAALRGARPIIAGEASS